MSYTVLASSSILFPLKSYRTRAGPMALVKKARFQMAYSSLYLGTTGLKNTQDTCVCVAQIPMRWRNTKGIAA